jgi:hypothetical protein
MTGVELLRKLTPLIPPPRVNLVGDAKLDQSILAHVR